MLAGTPMVFFLATTDAVLSAEFYQGRLGLQCTDEDDFAIVFDSGFAHLRIQKVKSFTPQPFTALGWSVVSTKKIVGELGPAGVVFERFAGLEQNAMGVWTSPSGAKIAWFKDPDGNLLSLTQSGQR